MNVHFHHEPLEASQQALGFVQRASALLDKQLVGLIRGYAPYCVGGEQASDYD
jgi:hypothetical protein